MRNRVSLRITILPGVRVLPSLVLKQLAKRRMLNTRPVLTDLLDRSPRIPASSVVNSQREMLMSDLLLEDKKKMVAWALQDVTLMPSVVLLETPAQANKMVSKRAALLPSPVAVQTVESQVPVALVAPAALSAVLTVALTVALVASNVALIVALVASSVALIVVKIMAKTAASQLPQERMPALSAASAAVTQCVVSAVTVVTLAEVAVAAAWVAAIWVWLQDLTEIMLKAVLAVPVVPVVPAVAASVVSQEAMLQGSDLNLRRT